MRGLTKAAALLLAPALAGALFIPGPDESPSTAFITLDVPEISEGDASGRLVLRFDVLASLEACGEANVSINGQPLMQYLGVGRGTLGLAPGSTMVARWNVSCVIRDGQPLEQLLYFDAEAIDGRLLQGAGFEARFRQMPPVAISEIAGSVATSSTPPDRQPEVAADPKRPVDPTREQELLAELEDLESLRLKLGELQDLVVFKERYIAAEFGKTMPAAARRPLRECDSVHCVVSSIFDKLRGAASHVYGEIVGGAGHGHGWHRPHFRHGHHGHCGDHGKGNHSRHEPRPHAPFHPPTEDVPPFPPLPFDMHGPPFPPPPFDPHGPPFPPPPFDPHGPPFPPPPFPPPGGELPPDDGNFGHEDAVPAPKPETEDHFDVKVMPMPVEAERPITMAEHPRKRPHHHHASSYRRPRPSSPPPLPFHPLVKILVGLFILFSVLGIVHHRYVHLSRADRQTLREARRTARERRRSERQARRARRVASFRAFWRRIFCRGRGCDDEEKEAMLAAARQRRIDVDVELQGQEHGGASDSEGSTTDGMTMEQDLAQFRVAADMVGEMVAAEEGRMERAARGEARPQRVAPPRPPPSRPYVYVPAPPPPPPPVTLPIHMMPSSPASDGGYNFPDCESADETLPAYDSEYGSDYTSDSADSSVVADGFRPGSQSYTPGPGSSSGSGVNDVLGDPKN